MKHNHCEGCQKPFTDDQWDKARHTTHVDGCDRDGCTCDFNWHEDCCPCEVLRKQKVLA